MKLAKIPALLAILLIVSYVVTSCSNKNSLPGRVYHNITARNNGYFNADLKMDQINNNLRESHKEDYKEILPIYIYNEPEATSAYSADLDEIIKKSSMVVRLHESSKWADDSYFLIGQAYYYKGDYQSALETFQYLSTEYKEGEKAGGQDKEKLRKKKAALKKKRTKARRSKKKAKYEKLDQKIEALEQGEMPGDESFLDFLKHQPKRDKTLIWIANAYTQLNKHREAESVITLIRADESFPERLQKDLELSDAYLAVSKENYRKAIQPMTAAITLTRKRKEKVRHYFILGQLYELTKNYSSAIGAYQAVLENNPRYEMAFNAKMNIARLSHRSNAISNEEIKKLLTDMLRDDKNIDFFDQIYYALAELELKQNNRLAAIEYLEKSVESFTTNEDQLALSYLKLGELHFEDEKYEEAQPYYAEALVFLDQGHERYPEVEERNDILQELVEQMQIIHEQDSLQQLASLSDEERERVIEDILEKKRLEEEDRRRNEASNNILAQNNQAQQAEEQSSGSAWYFYNQTAKAVGYNDFIKKWGKRPLESNWRRRDKGTVSEEFAEGEGAEVADPYGNLTDETGELDRDAILKNLPVDEESLAQSNQQMIDAYYTLANIYKNRLYNNPKAIETFEMMNTRFPGFEKRPELLYNLYLLYGEGKDATRQASYRSEIISQYPESIYAKILQDENYLAGLTEEKQEIQNFYASTYDFYLASDYDQVLQRKTVADSLFGTSHELKPKFDLLAAYTWGQKDSLEQYQAALEEIILKYPKDVVREKAEDLLWHLREMQKGERQATQKDDGPLKEYITDSTLAHYFVITYNDKKVKLNELINDLADFNDKFYSLQELKTSSLISNNASNVIVVKTFKDKKEAVDYHKKFLGDETETQGIPKEKLEMFIIHERNFAKMIKDNDFSAYKDFYNQNYIDQEPIDNQDIKKEEE